jgi:hypothetical protein
MEVKYKFKEDKPDEKTPKIIITVAFHKKGCASEVQHNLENRYEHSRSSEGGIRLGSSNNNSNKHIEKWTKIMLW